MAVDENVESLREILENLRTPSRLDEHAWAQGFLARSTGGDVKGPGAGLADAIGALFREMMPGSPPRRGKRLDTRWAEFGLLAAQYFAPFLFGTPAPASLREAWGGIDHAILLFVFGKDAPEKSPDEIARYRLVADESQPAPYSTLSDWHANGIKHLADLAIEREHFLAAGAEKPAIAEPGTAALPVQTNLKPDKKSIPWRMLAGWFVLLALLALLGLAGYKGWRIYQAASQTRADLLALQELASAPDLKNVTRAGELIAQLRADTGRLKAEAGQPARVMGPFLAWVPTYGGDLSASADLLQLADELAIAADESYAALAPVFDALQTRTEPVSPADLCELLVKTQPQVAQARKSLGLALETRARLNQAVLSPRTRALLDRIETPAGLLNDGLSILAALPQMVGAGDEGPRTYMFLAQNEDELRATGGFITLVGSFVIENGRVFGFDVQDSAVFQDWSKPYPSAPWQMQQYMNIPVMLLRDANWFPNFPETAARAEYLYAYTSKHSVDGVIAMDQQALVLLLDALGPVDVPGVPQPVTAQNVIQVMRASKVPTAGSSDLTWDRKAIIEKLADTILQRITSGKGVNWQHLGLAAQRALNEKHILLQFDDADLRELIARHGWDGDVRPSNGDFLMRVDSNVGYDKTNAVLQTRISYDIDLSDPVNPTSTMVNSYQNDAKKDSLCRPTIPDRSDPEFWYLINRCHHDYMRVYVPAGAVLTDATPFAIPAEWMPGGPGIPPRVDDLKEEITGLQGYGMLLVVPGGESLSTSFHFALPASILTGPGSQKTYTLKVQKQPGTSGVPLSIRIHLPPGAQVTYLSAGAQSTGSDILLETKLVTDVFVTVTFSMP